MIDEYSKHGPALVPGFLRGYRSWLVTDDRSRVDEIGLDGDLRLLSMTYTNYRWLPGLQHATCAHNLLPDDAPPHESAPSVGCECGFYAHHEGFPSNYPAYVEGSIKVTGRVILGTRGFRAEKAEIEALCIGSLARRAPNCQCCIKIYQLFQESAPQIIQYLGRRFRVPTFLDSNELMQAFPPMDISALIDPAVVR